MAVGVKLVLSGLLCVLLLGGAYEHIFNHEENKCEMTYMYEYPHFIPVSLAPDVQARFPHYGLTVYGEGEYAASLKKGHLAGIPVLFIPGNGGSHKQVRSLASVAYRKAADDQSKFHFNFFSVNLNEELGALFGPVLERQTQFVMLAIQHILSLYEGASNKPTSVVLVGHSMGGMVARAAHVSHNITAGMAPLIITQATPHTRPVLLLDHAIAAFYDKVNTYWSMEREFDMKSVVLVSVGGGRDDVQVTTAHTNTPLADIATTTANIPSCWLTTDHQAIVWCHQLVMPTVRALFDIVDAKTRQITTDRQRIIDVFNFHLVKRITGKKYKAKPYSPTIKLDVEASWKEIMKRQYTLASRSNTQNTYLMLPIHPGHQYYHTATVIATNLDKKDWVSACAVNHVHNNVKMCLEGENLSGLTKKMPGKAKAVELNLREISAKGHTHLIINLPPTNERTEIAIDIHAENARNTDLEVPAFLRSFTPTSIVDKTPAGALSYNITLSGFRELWQANKIILKPHSPVCQNKGTNLARLNLPWMGRESFIQSSAAIKSFEVELEVPPPSGDNSSVSLKVFLDPDCSYNILIQGSFAGVFRRLVLLYGPQIPAYVAVHLLITLSKQLKSVGEDGACPSVFSAMLTLTPLAVVPFVKLSNLLLKNVGISDDFSIMMEQGEHLGMLPILLFLGSLPLSLALSFAAWCLVLLCGNSAHSIITKVLGRSIGGGDVVAELAVSGLSRVPVLTVVALASLAYATCGSLALCLAGAYYFVKVFKLYEDFIEKIVVGFIPGTAEGRSDKALSEVHLHMTLMMLAGLLVLLNAPALMVWAKLLSYDVQLAEDPSLCLALVVLAALAMLWQKNVPRTNRMYYSQVSKCVHGLAVATLLFGSINLYRVSMSIAAAMLVVGLHQVFAPRTPREEQDTDSETSRPYMAQVDEAATDASNPSSTPESESSSQSE